MKNMLYRAKPLLKIRNKLCEIKVYTNFLLRLLKILLKCYFDINLDLLHAIQPYLTLS